MNSLEHISDMSSVIVGQHLPCLALLHNDQQHGLDLERVVVARHPDGDLGRRREMDRRQQQR